MGKPNGPQFKAGWHKVKHTVQTVGHHIRHFATGHSKKWWVIGGSLFSMAVIGVGFIVWYNSPGQVTARLEAQQQAYTRSAKFTGSHGTHSYNLAGGVPSLTQLANQRKGHPQLRGIVAIPRYNVQVPIFEGTDLSTLAWGAGTAKPGQYMGKGNYAIEAHNFSKIYDAHNVAQNWYFSNFEKQVAGEGNVTMNNVNIQPGTPTYTYDGKNVYTWIVTKTLIANVNDPYAGGVLSNSTVKKYSTNHKTPMLTMTTCYEQWNIDYPNQRIVVLAQMIKKQNKDQFKAPVNNQLENTKQIFGKE